MKKLLTFFILFSIRFGFSQEVLKLERSQINYTITHPFKTVVGSSKDSKGMIRCEVNSCEFLIAAPVKTFISKDSNRDLSVLEVTKATNYPAVKVSGSFHKKYLNEKSFEFEADVDIAGISKKYPINISKSYDSNGGKIFEGSFSIFIEAHGMERPSLLTVKTKDQILIDFNTEWK